MWEFLSDWFNQLEHVLREQMARVARQVKADLPRNEMPSSQSSVAMGESLMGDATRPPDGFDRLWGKLNQLSSLHSDEYKAAHPDKFEADGKTPRHVIVDNLHAIQPTPAGQTPAPTGPAGSFSRINSLMQRLNSLHSPQYQAAHPWLFRQPAPGSGMPLPNLGRLTQFFGRGRSMRSNRIVSLRRWARRLRRRFTMSPQTRVRLGNWMIHGGRALQMGAGRLSAIGGPTAQFFASGMARTGLALQGGGTALAGGAAVGTTALAGGAVLGGIAAAGMFVVASKKMGEALIDSQRELAQFNGSIANTVAMADVHRMRMDARLAAATSDNVAELNSAMRKLRESTQGLREDFTNLGLKLATWAIQGANFIMESKESISNGIADWLAWLMGTEEELAEERKGKAIAQQMANTNGPGRQFFDVLGNQPITHRPPLKPIP